MFRKLFEIMNTKNTRGDWKPPSYWQNELHMSAHDRHERSAAHQRARIARDTGLR